MTQRLGIGMHVTVTEAKPVKLVKRVKRLNPVWPFQALRFGFTLIEMMVVLVVLGIVAGMAVLSTGDFSRGRMLQVSAEQFAALLRLAMKDALVWQRKYAVHVHDQGYRFFQWTTKGTTTGTTKDHWQPLSKDLNWHDVHLASGMRVNCEPKSPIVVDSTGGVSPFRCVFRLQQDKPPLTIDIRNQPEGTILVTVLPS